MFHICFKNTTDFLSMNNSTLNKTTIEPDSAIVKYLKKHLNVKINGFNSINSIQQQKYLKHFNSQNLSILKKYFGFCFINKINGNFLGTFFFNPEEIIIPEVNSISTDLRFSKDSFIIPKNINLISKIILKKKFDQDGVFRVNSTIQRLKTANSLLQDIVEERVNIDTGLELFDKNFDLIDSCELYKNLLRSFNTTVISNKYINMIMAIDQISDENTKLICTKAMYYSLPHNNRCILESNVYLCYEICLRINKMPENDKQMDLDGIAIVMTPNLILKKDEDIKIEKVLVLVNFCKYFYKNFPQICKLDDN